MKILLIMIIYDYFVLLNLEIASSIETLSFNLALVQNLSFNSMNSIKMLFNFLFKLLTSNNLIKKLIL